MTKSNVTVIPSVGLWRQSSEVFQLVSVPMSNGTENWMRDWPKQLSLSMPLKGWNLVSALKLVIEKADQVMDEILWSKEDGYTHAPII